MKFKWTIGRKLFVAFVVTLLIQVVVGSLAYWNIGRLLEDSEWVTHTYLVIEQLDHQFSARQDMETGERGFVITGDENFLEPYHNGLANSAQSLQALRTLTADNPTQQAHLDELGSLLEQHDTLLDRIIDIRRGQTVETAEMIIASGEGKQIMDSIRKLVGEMRSIEGVLLVERNQSTSAAASQAVWTILFGTTIAIIFVTIAGMAITRSITRPMSKVIEELRALASGGADLTQRLQITSHDEIGELSQVFNSFIESLSEIIRSIVDTAAKLSSSTTEISSATNQVAAGADDQTRQVVQTSTAMEEMSRSIQEVANNARATAERSQAAVDLARGGSSQVMLVVNALQSTNTSLQALRQRSEQIDQLVKLIKEIAAQTNILALNAAIEAAGAGAEGARFNVVASEIRKLAGRTSQSTLEISSTVGLVQDEIQTIAEQTASMVAQAKQASLSLSEIVEEISSVNDRMALVSSSTSQQAETTSRVADNLEIIANTSQQTAQVSHETSQTTDDLSLLAEKLRDMTNRFKV